jgi:pyridoxine kinase
METHNNQKKIAVINDISGFGRCSIAVAMPIISYLRVQCCPVPTSIFSNHTGFEHYFFDDYTDKMEEYISYWERLGLEFNGICSGFLGSKEQIEIVEDFFKKFKKENTTAVVDPIMGDYGKPYGTYTPQMCREMKKLVRYADILTPNLTEACILTDREYEKTSGSNEELAQIAKELSDMGPDKVTITGVPQKSFLTNIIYEKGKEPKFIKRKKIGVNRSGTGDVFSAILAADAVNGVDFAKSVEKAADFIVKCIRRSMELEIPVTDGVCFEEVLYQLRKD